MQTGQDNGNNYHVTKALKKNQRIERSLNQTIPYINVVQETIWPLILTNNSLSKMIHMFPLRIQQHLA